MDLGSERNSALYLLLFYAFFLIALHCHPTFLFLPIFQSPYFSPLAFLIFRML